MKIEEDGSDVITPPRPCSQVWQLHSTPIEAFLMTFLGTLYSRELQ